MPNFNYVCMIGHLTRDVELIYTSGNTPIAKFGIATNHKWTDKGGAKHEDVCFVDCTAMGKTGENINKYFAKGRPILIHGRLDFQQWEAKDGGKRSKHIIMVNGFAFMDSGNAKPDGTDAPQEQPQAEPETEEDSIPF